MRYQPGRDLRPEVSAFLTDGTGDGGSLHFTLGVDNNTGVVCLFETSANLPIFHIPQKKIQTLEVEVDTVPTAPRLALTDDDGGHDYFEKYEIFHQSIRSNDVGYSTQRATYPSSSNQAFPSSRSRGPCLRHRQQGDG